MIKISKVSPVAALALYAWGKPGRVSHAAD